MEDYSVQLLFSGIYLLIYIYIITLITISLFKYKGKKVVLRLLTFALIFIISYFFSVRDINIGADTDDYFRKFENIEFAFILDKDIFFYSIMYIVHLVSSFELFLYVIAVLYMGCAYIAFCKLFPNYSELAFVVFMISPYFMQFGINVIRNGVAGSLMLLAFSYRDNRIKQYFFFLLSCLSHLSMVLVVLFYFFTTQWPSFRLYKNLWFSVLLLTLLGFDFSGIITYFIGYSNTTVVLRGESDFVNFLVYGLPVIILGFMYHKKFSKSETRIFCVYLLGSCLQLQSLSFTVMALRFAYFAGMFLPFIIPIIIRTSPLKNSKILVLFILLIVFSIKAQKVFFY